MHHDDVPIMWKRVRDAFWRAHIHYDSDDHQYIVNLRGLSWGGAWSFGAMGRNFKMRNGMLDPSEAYVIMGYCPPGVRERERFTTHVYAYDFRAAKPMYAELMHGIESRALHEEPIIDYTSPSIVHEFGELLMKYHTTRLT